MTLSSQNCSPRCWFNCDEKEDDFAQFLTDRVHVPRKAEDERYVAGIGYELSGGDDERFKDWYAEWLAENQFRTEVDARLLLEARRNETK